MLQIHRLILALLGGVPLLTTSLVLLAVWIDPAATLGGGWLRAAATLILLEFMLLHSGAFMAAGPLILVSRWLRLLWFLGFAAVYAVSICFYVAWADNGYVTWLVLSIVISRLLTLVILRDKAGTILIMQRSVIGMILLLITALICLVPLPPMGISEALRFEAFGAAEDMLTTHPQRTLAWGMVYFLVMGLIELYAGWRLPDWTSAEIEQTWQKLRK